MEEELIELLIGIFLTRSGDVFIVPQYAIAGGAGGGDWSCPDFVALDFGKQSVLVVEVSKAGSHATMVRKAKDRQRQWFEPLRAQLDAKGIALGWPIRLRCFVQRGNVDAAYKALGDASDVTFEAIEDSICSWNYWPQ